MTTTLAVLLGLLPIFTWLYRGGSTGLAVPYTRWASLLATPLVICGALALAAPQGTGVYEWGALVLSGVFMFAAQADGWGRQFDLGRNDKPDDETLYWVRDWFFKEKSSFARDLTGLFMRMAQFIPSAVAMWFFDPLAAIIPAFLVVGAPLVWVAEHKWLYPLGRRTVPWNDQQGVAWAEWGIGIGLAVTTIVAVLL